MAKIVSGPIKRRGIEGELVDYNGTHYTLRVKGKIKDYKPSTIELTKSEYERIIKDKKSDFHNFHKPVEGEFRFVRSFMNKVIS